MELWLKKIPEIFSYGAETGEIIYRICLSIVSSYIFYFIVVHLKTERDRENINQYVANKVRLIIYRCEARLAKLMEKDDIPRALLRQTSEIDISQAFEHHRKFQGAYSNRLFWQGWIGDLREDIQHSTESINKIFRKMPWLDSELVQILAKMEDSLLLLTKNLNGDLNPAVDSYFKHLKICVELSDYFNAKLAEHCIINIPYSESLRHQ